MLCSLLMGSAHAVAADFTPPNTDAEKIANAASAAPAAVGNDATVIDIDAKGNLRTLRKGTTAGSAIRTSLWSPGNDPQCMDENGWAWILAFLKQQQPEAGNVGFGYMLQGGADLSNTDPFAMESAHGMSWIITPPQVMILHLWAAAARLSVGVSWGAAGHVRPWIMWCGRPVRAHDDTSAVGAHRRLRVDLTPGGANPVGRGMRALRRGSCRRWSMEREAGGGPGCGRRGFHAADAGRRGGKLAALQGHRRELVDPLLAEHHGRLVKRMGDGALVEFASVLDALHYAVAIQRGMAGATRSLPPTCGSSFGSASTSVTSSPMVVTSTAMASTWLRASKP